MHGPMWPGSAAEYRVKAMGIGSMVSGKTCRLRPLAQTDFATTLVWHRTRDLRTSVLGYPLPVTQENAAEWYAKVLADQSQRAASFAVSPLESDEMLGLIRLSGIDWVVRSAEFSIVLGAAEARGRGIGREASALILRYGFDDLNLNRAYLRVAADNQPAIGLYRKLGFQQEGVCRQHAFVDGALVDVIMMGLLRAERATIDAVLE